VSELATASISYFDDGTELIGYLVTAADDQPRPGVLLIHDAFGVSEAMKARARRIAELGYSVFLADLWGGGHSPRNDDEIGPLIGSMASDRERWVGRVRAGHRQLLEQAQVATRRVTAVGYCFGGSSVLEYLRCGGELAGGVSFHGGLDLVGTDWAAATADASVLILTGAEDPTAPPQVVNVLEQSMSTAGVAWEVACYGQAKHAFTDPHADKGGRPDVAAYNARADRRSWNAFTSFVQELEENVADDA
jgi:dienelactone hydrolase